MKPRKAKPREWTMRVLKGWLHGVSYCDEHEERFQCRGITVREIPRVTRKGKVSR